jgi:LacI family transcriptional regulator
VNEENYTIKDIARMANVSRGTVDRVLHGRGKVSKETYEKVQLILEKINYQPNLIAQTLRKGEVCRLAVLLPDFKYDIFWKRPFDGIDTAIKDYASVGVRVDKFLFNPLKTASFRKNAKSILDDGYDGVLVAPNLYRESVEFFAECDKIKLPYVTFNTYIENTNALSHIGQDLEQSGRTAASLMNKLLPDSNEMMVVHVEESLENARHMQEKESGFNQYYETKNSSPARIHVLKTDNLKKIEKTFLHLLKANPGIGGIYVSTSKVHIIAQILEKHSIKSCLIGYDLLDENIRYLKSGHIDFLIYQNPGIQSNLGISGLVDHILFKTEIPEKKLLPIEIVIRENIENYLQ